VYIQFSFKSMYLLFYNIFKRICYIFF
jgi:hypothetical protein